MPNPARPCLLPAFVPDPGPTTSRHLAQDAVVRGRLGTLTHKILDAGVTATGLGHLFILGPMLRAGDGGWALPAATGTWAFIFVSAASQLITG